MCVVKELLDYFSATAIYFLIKEMCVRKLDTELTPSCLCNKQNSKHTQTIYFGLDLTKGPLFISFIQQTPTCVFYGDCPYKKDLNPMVKPLKYKRTEKQS